MNDYINGETADDTNDENQDIQGRQNGSKMRESKTSSTKSNYQAALQAIGGRELSILKTLDEIRLCTLAALSRMYYNSPYTARDHVQTLTNLQLLVRVQVDSHLVRQSVSYKPTFKNPVVSLGKVGTTFLNSFLGRSTVRSKPLQVPNLSWAHDVAVGEALSYLVMMARASYETPTGVLQHRAAVRLYGERHSGVWRETQITMAKRAGNDYPSQLKDLPQAVVRPDASLLWQIQPGLIDSPYAVLPDSATDPRWIPTRYSWSGAILHRTPNLQDQAASEQYGEGGYRWWLIELETGSNGAAVMQDKIIRYQRIQAMPTRSEIFGRACPQILVVTRTTAQIEWQNAMWRKHARGTVPGSVLITSLERLYTLCQTDRASLLNAKCFYDPLAPSRPQILTFAQAIAASIAITG